MEKWWLRRVLTAVLVLASSIIAIPSSSAASFSWTVPTALASKAGYTAALSSTGAVMLIGESTTGLFLSTDTGTTFNQVTSPNVTGTRYAVAVSGDGQKMFAVNYADTSVAYSLDGGTTWSLSYGVSASAGAACMSSDGSVWMTGGYANGSSAYVSTNNGTSWSAISLIGTGAWRSCALSSNGTKRYFLAYNTNLFVSSNSGIGWGQTTYSIFQSNCMAATDDGGTVIQTQLSGYVFTSNTPSSGYNQIVAAYGGGNNYQSCTISGNGSVIAVGRNSYGVRLSMDSGATWAEEPGTPNAIWNNIAVSRDGKMMIALSSSAIGNYIGTYTPPTSLALGIGANSVLTYRTTNVITANANYPGRVTFYANGKKIGGCVAVLTVSLVATCNYMPTIHGPVTLTAKLVPTNGALSSITSSLFRASVVARVNTR